MDSVSYEGQSGLPAIVRALDNLRLLLADSALVPQQAASLLGCINLHLADLAGVGGEFLQHLETCGGLLCPQCQGFVGYVSNLSGTCPHCGERFFAAATPIPGSPRHQHDFRGERAMNRDERTVKADADYSPEPLTLRDGTQVILRAIVPEDAPRLQALFHRLSPESIFFRFLGRPKELPREQAEGLANVDYQSRMAIVATLGEEIIGVARYAQSTYHEPGLMEAAVVVEDSYQSRGLGTILLNRLADYAREHGVVAFLASIHQSNERILRFIRKSGLRTESRVEAGLWEIRVYLD